MRMDTIANIKAKARRALTLLVEELNGTRAARQAARELDAWIKADRAARRAEGARIVSPVWYDVDGMGYETVTDCYGTRIRPALDIFFEQVRAPK